MTFSTAIEKGKQLIEALEVDKARGYFEGMLAEPAEAVEAHLWLARIDLMAWDPVSAKSHIDAAESMHPHSASLLSVKGLHQLMSGDANGAIESLEASREADPALAMNYPNLCQAYQNAGRLEESLVAGKKGVELAPKDANAHFAYSQALGASGNFQESLNEVSLTLQLNPMHEMGYLYAGRLFEAGGALDNLVSLFETGVGVNPTAVSLRRKLLEVYLNRENFQAALDHAAEILKLTHTMDDALAAAECARSVGNHPVAEWYFKFAIGREPGNWQPFYGLGTLYASDENWEAAEKELRDAVRCNPEAWEAQNQLGLVLVQLNQLQEAEAAFHAAAQAAPARPEPILNLVNCLASQGRKEEALSHAQGVLRTTEAGSFFHDEAKRLISDLADPGSVN